MCVYIYNLYIYTHTSIYIYIYIYIYMSVCTRDTHTDKAVGVCVMYIHLTTFLILRNFIRNVKNYVMYIHYL